MIDIRKKELISIIILISFFVIGLYFILTNFVIDGLILCSSGIILFFIIDKLPPLTEEQKTMNMHKIVAMFFYALGIVSLAYIEIILLTKTATNLFLLNIFAGGVFGAILSYLLFEMKEIVKDKTPGTLIDILRSVFFFLFIFCCLIVIAHL